MRMLTSLLTTTSGTAEVAGFGVVREPSLVRSRIGYIDHGRVVADAPRQISSGTTRTTSSPHPWRLTDRIPLRQYPIGSGSAFRPTTGRSR